MSEQKKKVFVGMSGGVDSSVSAAILLREGYEVVGVFIKVWQADFLPCTWREERREAMRVAAHLGIPLITLDLEKEYKAEVVDYMIREYGAGRVPNPDVMCNKHVKFGAFLDFAKKNGADFIATGHYARIQTQVASCKLQGNAESKSPLSDLRLETRDLRLLQGVDKEKDQTYFLWTLTQEQLAHTLFPVGHLQKPEVRALAKGFGLPNAEKKDSQGLCFMGAVDMADFLKHYLKTETGNVLDVEGNIIGTHDGAILYTIGQRHGFRTEKQNTHATPLFVVSKDILANTVTVGDLEERAHVSLIVNLKQVNFIVAPILGEQLEARIRYRGVRYPLCITREGVGGAVATFAHLDEFIARGQSLVLYQGEMCIGGGIVS